MHFNQQQQHHHDFLQNSNKATSLTSNGNANPITTPLTANTEKFTGSSASCTSSTDSGVHMSDNETTTTDPPSPPPQAQPHLLTQQPPALDPFSEQFQIKKNNSSADNKSNKSSGNSAEGVGRQKSCTTSEQLLQHSGNENNCHTFPYQINRNAIKNENVIKYNSHQVTMAGEQLPTTMTSGEATNQSAKASLRFNGHTRAESPASSTISSSDSLHDPPSRHHYNRSPAVSICSIDSSVIDSDSDSDLNDDLEGVHENYVIKKLGTQVSYPPKHPDIPKINNGLKVVNHQITPNGTGANGLAPPSPLDILANIGDNMAQVRSMEQAPCVSHRPQIAVSSSKDITIGDKHFYEGPVTIQQFLIDSRDKRKDINGTDNPTFEHDNSDTHNNAKDKNTSPAASTNPYMKILQRKKYIIPGVLAVIALIVLAIVFGIEASSDNKNTNSNNADSVQQDECIEGQLCVIQRDIWRAHPQTAVLDQQTLPLHRVVIAHTASEPCDSIRTCADRVRVIQEFHMNSFKWDDIGYNFLVGSDGRVYVGRGWDDVGAVAKGYNFDSVGIAFIGTYMTAKPTEAQLMACRLLIEEGVRLKKLDPNYVLNGARQLSATESPGDALYKIIRRWPHWTAKI